MMGGWRIGEWANLRVREAQDSRRECTEGAPLITNEVSHGRIDDSLIRLFATGLEYL
jgi:hypothetical protein